MLPSVKEISNLKDKRVVLRLDLNMPIEGGRVVNDFRLRKSLTTLKYLAEKGAKVVILSHIGRNKKDTLRPISIYLQNIIPHTFISNIYSQNTLDTYNNMKSGDVLLFENLRQFDGEEGNDPKFVEHLGKFGDVFVNDAFSVSHREHASIVGLPSILPSYAGFQFQDEVMELSKAFNPEHPFVLIIGGAKFQTKLPLIEKFIKKADILFVGGALANDIYKNKGYEVGISLTSDISDDVMEPIANSKKIFTPSDVVVLGDSKVEIKDCKKIGKNDQIVDAGKKSVKEIESLVKGAKLVIWNGPFGLYEKGFDEATKKVAKILSKSKATTIVGGGDTVAVIEEQKLTEKYTFVSTAGGAMLDFLEKGTIAGIEAIEIRQK